MFLVGNAFHVLPHVIAGGFNHIQHSNTGEGHWKLTPGYSWTPFPFADFNSLLAASKTVTVKITVFF